MKAIQFDKYGGTDVLQLVDAPTPRASAKQVLIRVEASGVNPADGKWRQGMFAQLLPDSLPMIPGYDVAGTIVDCGDSILPPGTRVAAMLDPISKGGYAQFALADPAWLAIIPDAVSFMDAAAAPTACLTGLQVVEEAVDVKSGQSVLISGATGMVGRVALRYALHRGAQVHALVRESARDAALALGAHVVLSPGHDLPDDLAFDHVIDTIGGEKMVPFCRRLRPSGKLVTVATTPIPAGDLPVAPAFYAVHPSAEQLTRILSDIANGTLVIPVERTLPLAQAGEAHRLVDAGGRCGKIVLLT